MKYFLRFLTVPAFFLSTHFAIAADLDNAKDAVTGAAKEAAKPAVSAAKEVKQEAKKAVEEAGYKTVTAEELQTLMKENKDVVVIDSRGGKWYDGEVIAGAKHLSADKTNKKTLAKLIKTKDTPVAFYCSGTECPASANAAHTALKLGYTNVYKFPGGIAEWKEKKLPTTKLK